jgi:phosphoserine phosphatase
MTSTASTPLVATLVAASAEAGLSDAVLARIAQAVPMIDPARWLAPAVAADMFPAGADGKAAEQAIREVLGSLPVDIVVQLRATRRKQLFLADMDSTMIAQECIDELADFVGRKAEVSEITERAMRGELAFEPALRERVSLLAGLPANVVDEIIATRITLTPGGRELVRTMRANGGYTALVSGGFTLFTGPISATIGFHEHRSNTLLVENGKLIGRVADPILGKEAKLAALEDLMRERNIAREATLAVGDGANDLAMLGAAGLGVAFRAKPAVAAAAHARIDHAGLEALLYAQGYAARDFVTI